MKIRIIFLIKVFTICLIVMLCVRYGTYINAVSVAEFVGKFGVVAPLVFIAVCTVKPLFFFLPSAGLTIVAGILFGFLYGTIYVFIGGMLSSIVGFYFARWAGKGFLQRFFNSNIALKKLDIWVKSRGKNPVLLMRLLNFPWDIVSYWAGCSDISFKDFYIVSLIMLIPNSFIYTYFGSKILYPGSTGFIISLLGLMLVVCAVTIMRQIFRENKEGV